MTDSPELLPALPLEFWRPTKETLHRYAQIVGKVALAKGVRRNHWWHMTYRLTARGWTTVPLGTAHDGPVFTCAFDFSTMCCGSPPTGEPRRRSTCPDSRWPRSTGTCWAACPTWA
ncbi:hypothetical protein GCM10027089_26620 [Nocardia thraciensis]